MPREKVFTKIIPKMYKWNAENMALFWFIKSQLQIFPTMTIEQAMHNFRRLTEITIDDWDDESMRSTYTRLQKEYYECTKENNRDTKP